MDVDFEEAPSRKRLKLYDAGNSVNKLPTFGKKWVSSPYKPSSPQERNVMELVGTPLVKKHGKKFSQQSRPCSILKVINILIYLCHIELIKNIVIS